jgi:hypothetical protein
MLGCTPSNIGVKLGNYFGVGWKYSINLDITRKFNLIKKIRVKYINHS